MSLSGAGHQRDFQLQKASEYRQHAKECRELAHLTGSAEQRAMLEKMAQTWEGLAKQSEIRRARQQRIAALEKRN